MLTSLQTHFGARVREHEPLASHTTFRIGGPARLWLTVQSTSELVTAVTLARQFDCPLLMLGSGANLLIRDGGFAGLVIQNRANRVTLPDTTGLPDGTPITLTVDSGVILPSLARRCAKHGLRGFEWAVGVPGTIGGAVVNNAGAYGTDMATNLRRAELLSPTGERIWQSGDWFEYGYRRSRLKNGDARRSATALAVASPQRQLKQSHSSNSELIDPHFNRRELWTVLQAELELFTEDMATVEATMNGFNQRRKSSQPTGATSGSLFKNPLGDYAGRLIEAAGLKGQRVGQAQISTVHANFFQNLGGATATEMLALIDLARETVFKQHGVELQPEIEIIGDD